MRRIALGLLVVLGLTFATPLPVSADTNSDAIRSLYQKLLSTKNVPTEFSFDLAVNNASKAEPAHVVVHMTGVAESGKDPQDIQGAKGAFQISVEGSQGKTSFRGSAELRVVDAAVYAKVNSFDLSGPSTSSDIEQLKVQYVGQWYKLGDSKSTGVSSAASVDTTTLEEKVAQMAQAVVVRERKTPRGTRYTIRIQPAVLKEMFAKQIPGMQSSFNANGLVEFNANDAFQRMVMGLHAMVKTPVPSFFDSSASAQVSNKPVDVTLDMTFRLKPAKSVSVQAPEKFISIEDKLGTQGSSQQSAAYQLAAARDAQRRADINTILNACYQYALTTNGAFPADFPNHPVQICATGRLCDGISLQNLSNSYLSYVPVDPSLTQASKVSGYTIQFVNQRLTVAAPLAETVQSMEVTR
jgi:hypothetical protein